MRLDRIVPLSSDDPIEVSAAESANAPWDEQARSALLAMHVLDIT